MQKFILLIYIFIFFFIGCSEDRYKFDLQKINSENLKFAPDNYSDKPALPSPALSETDRELVKIVNR